MRQSDLFIIPRRPWNAGRLIGPKAPLKPKHVWAIRQQLKVAKRVRDLAIFNCALDAKLRACDLVKLRVSDVAPGVSLRLRSTVIQQKTGRPVPSRSRSQREMRSRLGLRCAGVAMTTGYSPAEVMPAPISARVSTLGSLINGSG